MRRKTTRRRRDRTPALRGFAGRGSEDLWPLPFGGTADGRVRSHPSKARMGHPAVRWGIRFGADRGIGPTQASLDGAPGGSVGHSVWCGSRHRSHPSKLGWGTRRFRGASGLVRIEASVPPKQAWMGHPAVPWGIRFGADRGIGPTQASLDGAPGGSVGHPVWCGSRHRSHPSKLGWGTRRFRGASGLVRIEASVPPKQAWMGHPAVP